MSLDTFKERAKEIVGPEWTFDDPVDRYPYARDMVTDGLKRYTEMLPDLVVMPVSAHEIQKIVVLANEQKVPLFVIGSGSSILIGSLPSVKGAVTVDCKRMQNIEIDFDNLTAIFGFKGDYHEKQLA